MDGHPTPGWIVGRAQHDPNCTVFITDCSSTIHSKRWHGQIVGMGLAAQVNLAIVKIFRIRSKRWPPRAAILGSGTSFSEIGRPAG